MGYTKEAIKGISWLLGFRILTRVIAFGRIAVIARILTPSQFGLFGIASIILAFIEMLTETGINIFLIQKKDDSDNYINTAWIISIIRGILIAICILVTAPFIVSFFSAPEALLLLQLISIVPLIRGFINPSIIKFHKDLQFNREVYFRSAIFFFDAIVTIFFTFLLKSPVGIIVGLIGGVMVEVILSYVLIRPIPHFIFRASYFRQIIHRGKWITMAGVFNYVFENTDNIVVGKLLGTASLGLYDAAYKISLLPLTEIGDVLMKVLFPIYVKFVDEKERLQRAFIKTILLVMFVIPPIGMAIFLFPKEIVQVVLGPQWINAAPVLRVLAIFGVIRAILSVCNALFFAAKKQHVVTQINVFSFLVLAVSIVFFVRQYGIVGAAYSALFASVLITPFVIYHVFLLLTKYGKKR